LLLIQHVDANQRSDRSEALPAHRRALFVRGMPVLAADMAAADPKVAHSIHVLDRRQPARAAVAVAKRRRSHGKAIGERRSMSYRHDRRMPSLGALASRALDLAFPGRCAGCGREGPPLCATCAQILDARLDLPAGVPMGLPADIPAPLLQLEWCAPFDDTVRRALHDLKYAGERRLAEPLGAAIARRWRVAGAGGDVVVPVPVHRDRARDRGYDQAVLVAAVAARDLALPMASILERSRTTTAQFDLDRGERAGNVAGAFRVLPRPGVERPLHGRWVVLVDDIVTTGATLAACATTVLAAGAMAVSAITVARER
jgi:ComF family protein